jgi:NADPH:quinone reductase-like Zn-dependent oxidoreductase
MASINNPNTEEIQAVPKCMSWKQVEAGEPSSSRFLRKDQRPLRAPGSGEVLVQVRACSINPVDHRICEGRLPSVANPPLVPCSDFAGVVVGASPDAPFTMGDKVFGYCPNRWGRKRDIAAAQVDPIAARYLDAIGGAMSDFIIVPVTNLTLMPDGLDFPGAAALPTVGMTCYDIMELMPNQLNYCVVIIGAAGGVGTLLTQLCKNRGYRVWCVTRTENFERMKSLGAHACVDYTKRTWNQYFQPDKNSDAWVDAVLDCSPDGTGANWQLAKTCLVRSGTYVSLTWQDPDAGEDAGATIASYWQSAYRNVLSQFYFKYVQMVPDKAKLDKLCDFYTTGMMKPVIDTIYGFDDVHVAFEKSMSKRANGKLVISWSEEDITRQAGSTSISLPTVSDLVDNATVPRRLAREATPPSVVKSTSDRRRPSPEHTSVPYVVTSTSYDNRPDLPDLEDDHSEPKENVYYRPASANAVPAPQHDKAVGMTRNDRANSETARLSQTEMEKGKSLENVASIVAGQVSSSSVGASVGKRTPKAPSTPPAKSYYGK